MRPPEDPLSADVEGQSPRLVAAVREYMSALEAGLRPSRREFLNRYADIADELAPCLDGLAFVNSAAKQAQDVTGGTPMPAFEPSPTQPLGDFRLIREIGRGGMGVVYEAVQLSLGRRVAVKVLPFTAALDPRHLQRFRNEAQAAAQLHHTNIVPVYAVGCDRSVHFYAMQLIEGQSVAGIIRSLRAKGGNAADRGDPATQRSAERGADSMTHARTETLTRLLDASAPQSAPPRAAHDIPLDSLHLRADEPAASLSTMRAASPATFYRTAARLAQQAAEALDYAHQAGIVHRDIKPANLLVDIKGNLWITDFGLAQVLRESELTQTGDLLGTLAYMSPEQASGKAVVLDERTDVYSLGVTLYEMLTLRKALRGKTREAMLQELSSVDPPAARTVDKRIPRELEIIVRKATAKEPRDRYQNARALADDLARFLRDEPIRARPPSLWDQTVKWTRRHRSLAATGLLLLAVIAAGSALASVLLAREQANTSKAYELERQKSFEAMDQRQQAQRNFLEARAAVNTFARIAQQDMNNDPAAIEVKRELLSTALTYYESFLKDVPRDAAGGGGGGAAADLAQAQEQVQAILDELNAGEDFARVLSRVTLLSDRTIWRELGLTPTQQTACLQLQSQITASAPSPRELTPDELRDRYTQLALTADTALAQTLTPAQFTRLRQLARQMRGPSAFSDPEISSALALTAQQKIAIRDITDAWRDSRLAAPHDADRPEPPEAREAAAARAIEQILQQLSPDQRAAWLVLTGEPFTPIRRRPGGFGPPGSDFGGDGGPPFHPPGMDRPPLPPPRNR